MTVATLLRQVFTHWYNEKHAQYPLGSSTRGEESANHDFENRSGTGQTTEQDKSAKQDHTLSTRYAQSECYKRLTTLNTRLRYKPAKGTMDMNDCTSRRNESTAIDNKVLRNKSSERQ